MCDTTHWCRRLAGGKGNTMPCESCAVQFSVFKRKRACCECERYYCSGCLRRGGGTMCAPCRVLSTRPLSRNTIAHLKVRDLQCFLQRQNISTRGCVEKDELVSLCVSHVNSASYRRRGQRAGGSPFHAFKGLTTNINEFLTSAFDLRAASTNPANNTGYSSNCLNSAHAHASAPPPPPRDQPPTTTPPRPNPERFTTTPGGEADIRVPVPELSPSVSRSTSGEQARVYTDDCFEIEDLNDADWEFVNRPADPLPHDSDEIIVPLAGEVSPRSTLNVPGGRPSLSATRAASELDLSIHQNENTDNTDSTSLQDEPITEHDSDTPKRISLEQFKSASELDLLSAKKLKELLIRNRVEYRGCLERTELLERAQTLWRNHQQYTDDVESLPLSECCKICMAAPLECVLLECGHMAACTRCATQLAECPICRQYVVRAVRVFRS